MATEDSRLAVRVRASLLMADRASSELPAFENNGGDHAWVIHAAGGAARAQAGAFTSFDDAAQAAESSRAGASSARHTAGGAYAPAVLA